MKRLKQVGSAEELSQLLNGREVSPGQYSAHCPGHDDRNPSFSIYQAEDIILVHCFAECEFKDILKGLEIRGISANSLLKESPGLPEGISPIFEGKHYVSHWAYKDEHGEVIGYTVRYESAAGKKTPIPYFKKSDGKWKAGFPKNKKRILYNMDKIVQALDEEEIYVVEGEKCADTLTDLGFLATTSPGGCKGAKQADWTPLANKHVIIWPDNDKEGKIYATDVFRQLEEVSESAQVVEQIDVDELDLNEKEDVYDWVGKLNGRDDILSLPRIPVTDHKDIGVIIVEDGENFRAMDQAEEMLLKKKPYEIFQRAGMVVRIFNPDNEKDKPRDASIKLLEVRSGYLTDFWNRELTFGVWRRDGLKQIDPPGKLATTYLTRAGHWKLNHLNGLIFSPTLRPDGTVLEHTGYDKLTGLYLVDSGKKFNPLEKEPNRDLATRELERLRHILQDFPFVSHADESVVLAAILTALVRKNFITSPAFGFNAPAAGSGKTLLANIVHIIATGTPVTPMSIGFSKEEQEKLLFAKLLEGRPIVLIDNVEEPIKSGVFCEIMTSPKGYHSGRVLGVSETKDVPTTVTFLITGNNLSFQGDMTRRVLLCTIDPKEQNPENRTGFKIKNLPEHVMENRTALVKAGLYILRAYIVAGKPKMDIPQWGGFEEWSDLVRSALVWLGCADPYETKQRVDEDDPEKQSLKTIINLWHSIYEYGPVKASEIVNDCNTAIENKDVETDEYDLGQVLLEVTRTRGKSLAADQVGRWLSSYKDRIMDSHKIVKDKYSQKNVATWKLEKVNR